MKTLTYHSRPVGRISLAVAIAIGLAACGGTQENATGGAGDGLRIVGPFEVHSLEPAEGSGFFTLLQVAETLVDTDAEGELVPELATEWSVSRDQRTWRFELPEDVTFHDGSPVTPEAVAASLDIARRQPATPLASAPVTSVAAAPGAVEVRLSSAFAPLPATLAHASAQILAPSAYGDDDRVQEIVGTGPYRVEDYDPPSSIAVTAFDGFRADAPAITDVSYQAVGRAESRALMAESGQADVVFGLDPVARQRVDASDAVAIRSITLPRTIVMKVNADHPVLGDLRVRRALSLALDRTAMATALLRDEDMAATQLFPPSLPEWHTESLQPLRHDADEAAQLLADAGWTEGEDGVRERDGERLELDLRTFPDRPELPVLATAMQSALAEVGVSLNVKIGNSSEIASGHQDGSLELALYARNFALVPDPLATMLEDFAPGGADFGAMGWEHTELAAALGDLADGGDRAQAAARRAEVAGILQDELPLIPIAWYRQSAVVSDDVAGFELDPLERSWNVAQMSWAQ